MPVCVSLLYINEKKRRRRGKKKKKTRKNIPAQAPWFLETNHNGREKSDTGPGRDMVGSTARRCVTAAVRVRYPPIK